MSRLLRTPEDPRVEGQRDGFRKHAMARASHTLGWLAVAIGIFMVMFGFVLYRATRVPNDAEVDRRIAQMRRRMVARRSETVAAVADRIAGSAMGRRAQEEWLKDAEVSDAAP